MSIDPLSATADECLDVVLPVRATGLAFRFAPPAPIAAHVCISPAFACWALSVGSCLQVLQARSVFFRDQRLSWDAPPVGDIETELQVTLYGVMWWGRRAGNPLLFHTGPFSVGQLRRLAARAEPQVVADHTYLQTTTRRAQDHLGAFLRSLAVMTTVIPP